MPYFLIKQMTGGKIMSDDSYTEITSESWWDRIKNALGGALLGLILFLAAFPLLFWNEGRAVDRAKTLEEGASTVISIDAKQVEAVNEGKLVHLSDQARSDETLTDAMFGVVAANVINLRRVVMMYQWEEQQRSETQEKLGGGTETVTTYTHTETWSSDLFDSSTFKQPEGHRNPTSMPFSSNAFHAEKVTVGAFSLSVSLVNQLDKSQRLPMTAETFEQVPEEFRDKLHIHDGYYYMGQDATRPQIGDLRISFEVVRPAVVSIVAKQVGSSLASYTTQVGGEIELFEYGTVTAEDMFKHEVAFNTMLTWILRLVGFIVMFIGLNFIFGVLRTLAAVLPFLADIVGFVGALVSFVIAATLSLITIAIAWIFYRPLLGIMLLAIAGGLLYFLKFARKPQEPAAVPETSG
ncbi:MAG: hypothetical protein DRR19_08420 [Candidatus Parabeggiatoa sp. nov. 1]|nr:MAG: hypothetical protein DRR19_08420 [Gammaproteobacteria bacterium]